MSHLPFKISFKVFIVLLIVFHGYSPVILNAQNVGINTEVPEAGLHIVSDNGLLLTGDFGNGLLPLDGYGTRLMFSPKTASFRSGRLTDEDGGIYENWWHFNNTGDYSFAVGANLRAKGYASFASGHKNQADGEVSFVAGGRNNIASGGSSFVTGRQNTAFSFVESVFGMNALEYTPSSTSTYFNTDRLFVVGNGENSSNRNNAFTILKNGNIGIATATPTSRLHISGSALIDNGRLTFANTANSIYIGDSAGGLFTGSNNTGIGYESLKNTSTGSNNTALGYWSMLSNTSGSENTALGYAALRSNSSGNSNVAIGNLAMNIANGGSNNVAIGYGSGTVASGSNNVYLGYQSGLSNTGSNNLFLGNQSGAFEAGSNLLYIDNSNTSSPLIYGNFSTNKVTINDSLASKYFQITQGASSGHVLVSDDNGNAQWINPSMLSSTYWTLSSGNIYRNSHVGINTNNPQAPLHTVGDVKIESGRLSFELTGGSVLIGADAGFNNAGDDNVFIGGNAGYTNTGGSNNIAMGSNTLSSNTTGNDNISIGRYSLTSNTNGANNVALGTFSLSENNGFANVAIGGHAMERNQTGEENVALGTDAGYNTLGDGNTFLGYASGHEALGDGNIFVGRNAGSNETGSNKLYIDNSNTAMPLIYGDLSTNHLTINDSLTSRQYRVNGGRISFINTGQSVFIGENAGQNDDRSDNNSVFIGYQAGRANTEGNDNIAIGANALDDAATSHYNIAIGESALGDAEMDGELNIALGNFSMENNETGSINIAIGQNSLGQNTTGMRNIAIGHTALDANTSGGNNLALGDESLGSIVSANYNVGVGNGTLSNNVSGHSNVAVGYLAGLINSGSGNVFLGYEAGFNETGNEKLYISNSSTTSPLIYGDFLNKKVTINDSLTSKYFHVDGNIAISNGRLDLNNGGFGTMVGNNAGLNDVIADQTASTFIGYEAGKNNTTGAENTALGAFSLTNNINGSFNVALGNAAMDSNTSGSYNVGLGYGALSSNTSGTNNIAIGLWALQNSTGSLNTAVGNESGSHNLIGTGNTFLGSLSGHNSTGSDNVFLGKEAGKNETGSNKLYISNSNTATPLLYGDFSTKHLFVNNSLTVNEELSVGTSIANSTLEVNGSVAAKFKTPLVAGTTHPDGTGMVWRYNSGSGTITLPVASSCANRMYVIINQTGTPRTITSYRDLTTTPQTTINSSVALWLMSDGTEWWQIK